MSALITLGELMRQIGLDRCLDNYWLYGMFAKTLQAGGVKLDTASRENLLQRTNELAQAFAVADLHISASLVRDVAAQLNLMQKDADGLWVLEHAPIAPLVEQLSSLPAREAKTKFFLVMEPDAAALYAPDEPLLGSDVGTKFPSLIADIDEAGKCLALGRTTATAFHLIRCLEGGITGISRCLGIPDPTKGAERNWGSLLTKVEAACKSKWPTDATRQAGDGHFFESVWGSLRAMQNPYRNATMHLEKTYTEDEAKGLQAIVKSLMQRIASRMDEQGLPLA